MIKCASLPTAAICLISLLWIDGVLLAADTGDAPATYGQASHAVDPIGPYLGDVAPDDNAPQFTVDALGDDEDGIDDEGGVFAFPILVENAKSYDTNVFATNASNSVATLSGWVDFDGNGRFDSYEYASASVAAGAINEKFKLAWPDLSGVSSDFFGLSYARFRISTTALTQDDANGPAPDGEVEDYTVEVFEDSDGDERPDIADTDNDNDGIPDEIEGLTADTDGDGIPDYLDTDSDGDGVPDYVEAGANPLVPIDTDGDGIPDFQDLDSDNDGAQDAASSADDDDGDGIRNDVEGDGDTDGDGVPNSLDLDSDNDTIPDAVESGADADQPIDTDADGVADFMDLDSDNDGIIDIREANRGELNVNEIDTNNDGRVDNGPITGINGLLDLAETVPDSGVLIFAVSDADVDGIYDFRDLDSDNDGVSDIAESLGVDSDGDFLVDSTEDNDQDGIVDSANTLLINGTLPDTDIDGLPDFQDADADGSIPPAQDPSDPVSTEQGVVETGLSGGAGCSVGSTHHITSHRSSGWDLMNSLLVLVSAFVLIARCQLKSGLRFKSLAVTK